jgi:PIN domain nuclease of toxin-antitoxin system
MRYIIDTNVFVNFVIEGDLLSGDVRTILKDYENTIYISSESIKEFVHLVQTGRIILKKDFRLLDVFDLIDKFCLNVKYVSKEHLRTLSNLASVENHNDPSDRLIISQAITEKMPLISSDTKFPKYKKHGLDLIYNR